MDLETHVPRHGTVALEAINMLHKFQQIVLYLKSDVYPSITKFVMPLGHLGNDLTAEV